MDNSLWIDQLFHPSPGREEVRGSYAYKPKPVHNAAPNVIPWRTSCWSSSSSSCGHAMLQKTTPVDLAMTNNAREMKEADKDDAIWFAVTPDAAFS